MISTVTSLRLALGECTIIAGDLKSDKFHRCGNGRAYVWEISAWDSKISLRGATLNALGFGFAAGTGFGIFILRLVLLRVPVLSQLPDSGYLVPALALAARFYFIAMSRARDAKRP